MENLSELTKRKSLSEAAYNNSPCQLTKHGQFACHQVTKATAQLKIYRIAAEIYSEEAKLNFLQAFKSVNSHKVTDITCSSLFSSVILERKWKKPEVMENLLEIYTQLINTFYSGEEAVKVTERLSRCLLGLDSNKNYSELLKEYHKETCLIRVWLCSIERAQESFCEQHITFFCGILIFFIELKIYLGFIELKSYLFLCSFISHFMADFLLAQLSEDGSRLFLSKESMTQYCKIVNKKIEQFKLFANGSLPKKVSPLYFLVNNVYWSKIYNADTETVINYPRNYLWSHFHRFTAPQHICNIILNGLSIYDQSYYDELTAMNSTPSSSARVNLSVTTPFDPNQIRIGEEFEFYFTSKSNYEYSAKKLVNKWYEFIEDRMFLMHIPKLEYSLKKGENEDELFFTFGNWHCIYYEDIGALEVNCSPYTMDQHFTCNGKNYTAYELFDLFINRPADIFLLQGRSGHKHIDIRHSIANNPELLFRFLLDVENESFLTKALGREDRCKEWFPYLFMSNNADQLKTLIDHSVELINKEIAAGKSAQPSGFYTHAYALNNLWRIIHENSPIRIKLSPGDRNDHNDTKVCEPDGTLEMRFWHCARSGEEARKINEIIIAWMKTLAKEQKDKIPLSFKMNDFNHLDTHEKIIKCFDNFCERIGLNPKEYYGLLRKR